MEAEKVRKGIIAKKYMHTPKLIWDKNLQHGQSCLHIKTPFVYLNNFATLLMIGAQCVCLPQSSVPVELSTLTVKPRPTPLVCQDLTNICFSGTVRGCSPSWCIDGALVLCCLLPMPLVFFKGKLWSADHGHQLMVRLECLGW